MLTTSIDVSSLTMTRIKYFFACYHTQSGLVFLKKWEQISSHPIITLGYAVNLKKYHFT